MIDIVKDVFAVHAVTDLLFKQQFNDKDCGVFVVDNLTKLAARNTARLSAEGLKALLSKGNESAQNLRKDHDVALGLKAHDQAVKILQEAVSLGKGHMVKYLADHAHSKGIESLKSIDLIKDAYLGVLQKGFGYTKEFIKAIQSNYKFSGKVAQDFAKLVQIDTTFRTKTTKELLDSFAWDNLGHDINPDHLLLGDFVVPDHGVHDPDVLGAIHVEV